MSEGDEPKISVVLPNYNHGDYVWNAIESIGQQTYPNLELIVVDDGSTDDSLDVINEEGRHVPFDVKVIPLNENAGKWNALNTGIDAASGKLIVIQDADDAAHPYKVERQYKCLKNLGSFHNLCGFHHCYNQEDVDNYLKTSPAGTDPTADRDNYMDHKEVLQQVYKGHMTPGINHFYTGNYEVHGGSPMFYKQLWVFGMKFLPGNMGLRVQKAEDSDHNTKMTLLLQKTSVLKEKLYCYRRNTATNPAYLEEL